MRETKQENQKDPIQAMSYGGLGFLRRSAIGWQRACQWSILRKSNKEAFVLLSHETSVYDLVSLHLYGQVADWPVDPKIDALCISLSSKHHLAINK